MNIVEQLVGFLYGNGSLLLIIPSLLLLGWGLVKKSHIIILVSYLVFFPIFLALIFLQMQPYFYPFLILSVIQLFYYFKIKNNVA